MKNFLTAVMLFLVSVSTTLAGEMKTVTLNVEKMTCNMCPITVKKALKKIDGVSEVVAKYEGEGNGWAKVTFDPEKTNIEDLTFATEEAGYPSQLKP
ncbi:MAG: cation transporter [Gammaproteobacteria bacterium]|nr:cation transporter [Gammaproteobacteria bacterium]MDH5802583.1 cation transporter [Gammaproteobacteria bacterium]